MLVIHKYPPVVFEIMLIHDQLYHHSLTDIVPYILYVCIYFVDTTKELKENSFWREGLQLHWGLEMIQTLNNTEWRTKKGCE